MELETVLKDLEDKFSIDLYETGFNTLETRVLIPTDYDNEIIVNGIISINNKIFDRKEDENGKFHLSKQFGSNWLLKIYPKTKHLLTIEVKYLRSKLLEPYGISVVADLLNPNSQKGITERIKEVWEMVRFCDGGMNWEAMTKSKTIDFERMRNSVFWLDGSAKVNPYGMMNKEKRKDANKRFYNTIKRYETSTRFRDITNQIQTISKNLTAEKTPPKNTL